MVTRLSLSCSETLWGQDQCQALAPDLGGEICWASTRQGPGRVLAGQQHLPHLPASQGSLPSWFGSHRNLGFTQHQTPETQNQKELPELCWHGHSTAGDRQGSVAVPGHGDTCRPSPGGTHRAPSGPGVAGTLPRPRGTEQVCRAALAVPLICPNPVCTTGGASPGWPQGDTGRKCPVAEPAPRGTACLGVPTAATRLPPSARMARSPCVPRWVSEAPRGAARVRGAQAGNGGPTVARDTGEPFGPGVLMRCQGSRARSSRFGSPWPGRGRVRRSSPALPGRRCSPPVTPAPEGTRNPPSAPLETATRGELPERPRCPGRFSPYLERGGGRPQTHPPPVPGRTHPPVPPLPRAPGTPWSPPGARYLRQRAGQRRSRAGGARPGPSRPVPVPVPPPLPAPGEAGAPPVGTGRHRSAGTPRAPGEPPQTPPPIPAASPARLPRQDRETAPVPGASPAAISAATCGHRAQRDRGMWGHRDVGIGDKGIWESGGIGIQEH